MVKMGMDPNNPQDVKKFDAWYFEFYPYLLEYLDELELKNANVLEVGIGLGTVSRYLTQRSKSLTCLDIAQGAISYVKSTTQDSNNINYVCQSLLDYVPKKQFDVVIAIGSLHHTGDLEKSLAHVEKLLTYDGTILVMVYYAFQPRRIIFHPVRTLGEFIQSQSKGFRKKLIFEEQDAFLRARADVNLAGEAAPYTVFSSRRLFSERNFVRYDVKLKNFHRVPIFDKCFSRNFFLKHFSRFLGCDIYALGRSIQKL